MNDRLLTCVLGLALATAAGPAAAQGLPGGLYVGGVAGVQFFSDNEDDDIGFDIDIDTGYVIGALVGFRFANLRAEAEFDYQETDARADVVGANNVDVEILRYTAGLYYDFSNLQWPITPYVGGGLGLASIDSDGGGNDATNFTWHGEIGGSFDFTPRLELVPAYRYEWIDESGLVSDDPVRSHAIRLGVRWSF